MTKTYEQRLAEIAEEFSEALYNAAMGKNGPPYNEFKETKPEEHKEAYDALILPLAAIALKHMAEEYKEALTLSDPPIPSEIEMYLQSLGLIQPKKP